MWFQYLQVPHDFLCSSPIFFARITQVFTKHTNSKSYVQISVYMSMHKATNSESIQNFIHFNSLNIIIRTLEFRQSFTLLHQCNAKSTRVYVESLNYSFNISCLRQIENATKPITMDLNPRNQKSLTRCFISKWHNNMCFVSSKKFTKLLASKMSLK